MHPTPHHPDMDTIGPALKRYALRLTRDEGRAEDLLQDTYMSMLSRREDATRVNKPGPYMMSIMHNLFIDETRRTKPDTSPVPLDDIEPVSADASPTLKITCQETMAAIADLPADYRVVLQRHACQGQSYGEISKALGIPIGTVMSRIARARAALCRALELENGVALLEDQ